MTAGSSPAPVLPIAVIGAGSIAQRYFDAVEERPDAFELVAVCEPNPAAVERVHARFPNARVYTTVDDLVAAGGFQAAVVATPHFLHFEQAAAVAKAGISVLVEKPLVTTTEQMRELRKIADSSGAIVVAGQTRRHSPEIIAARAKTTDPETFGQLQSFDILSFQDLRPAGGPEMSHWLFDGERAGGGVAISLAIHQIDMVRFLTGADYTAVLATARFDAPFVNGAESRVAAALDMSNGAVGTLHADYLASRSPFAEAMTLIGERGSVTQHAAWLGEYRGPLSFATSQGIPTKDWNDQFGGWERLEDEAPMQVPFTNQLLAFAATVRGEQESVSSLIDNFNTIACIEAIVRSARTGQRVEVETW